MPEVQGDVLHMVTAGTGLAQIATDGYVAEPRLAEQGLRGSS